MSLFYTTLISFVLFGSFQMPTYAMMTRERCCPTPRRRYQATYRDIERRLNYHPNLDNAQYLMVESNRCYTIDKTDLLVDGYLRESYQACVYDCPKDIATLIFQFTRDLDVEVGFLNESTMTHQLTVATALTRCDQFRRCCLDPGLTGMATLLSSIVLGANIAGCTVECPPNPNAILIPIEGICTLGSLVLFVFACCTHTS